MLHHGQQINPVHRPRVNRLLLARERCGDELFILLRRWIDKPTMSGCITIEGDLLSLRQTQARMPASDPCLPIFVQTRMSGLLPADVSAMNQGRAHDPLCFGHDRLQVLLVLEALGIDLVFVLGAGRASREPAARGHYLQAADRRPVAGGAGQLGRDRLARQLRLLDGLGRQLL